MRVLHFALPPVFPARPPSRGPSGTARVALVESHVMGGDRPNIGCVPSRALISAARVAASARRAGDLGVRVGSADVDMAHPGR